MEGNLDRQRIGGIAEIIAQQGRQLHRFAGAVDSSIGIEKRIDGAPAGYALRRPGRKDRNRAGRVRGT